MRNYQRQLAITLITSITMTSIASSSAWADITIRDRSGTQQVEVERYKTVMVPQRVRVTDVQDQQVRTTDIIRDNSADLTCRAYAGMDRQILEEKYNQLRLNHVENFVKSPVGATGAGAAVGATIGFIAKRAIGAVLTGGIIGAALGWLGSKLFSWFKGKDAQERDLAERSRQAEYDQEVLQLNCMENELKKSQIYAGTIPGQMPSGVSASNESKIVAYNSGRSSSSSNYYESGRSNSGNGYSSGSAGGEFNNTGSMTESTYNSDYNSGSSSTNSQGQAEERSNSSSSSGNSVASCLY